MTDRMLADLMIEKNKLLNELLSLENAYLNVESEMMKLRSRYCCEEGDAERYSVLYKKKYHIYDIMYEYRIELQRLVKEMKGLSY